MGPPPILKSWVHPLAKVEQMQPPFHHLESPCTCSTLAKGWTQDFRMGGGPKDLFGTGQTLLLFEVFPAPCLTSKVQELSEQCNYPSMCPRLGAPGWRAGIGLCLPCGTKVKQQRGGTKVGLSRVCQLPAWWAGLSKGRVQDHSPSLYSSQDQPYRPWGGHLALAHLLP